MDSDITTHPHTTEPGESMSINEASIMNRKRPFSIYLLKSDITTHLRNNNKLTEVSSPLLPDNAKFFITQESLNPPWWKDYFNLQQSLQQGLSGALLVLPSGGNFFLITFGNVISHVPSSSYEYDFGIITTLNALDPRALKSTDLLRPEGASRHRIQLPNFSELVYFDFDHDSNIVKSLTGKVRKRFKPLFSTITGCSNVRISVNIQPHKIQKLCSLLYFIYKKDTYKSSFPDIRKIQPIHDPSLLKDLNDKLVNAIKSKSDDLILSIPELIDYSRITRIKFCGKDYYDVFTIESFWTSISDSKLNEITEDKIKKNYRVSLWDDSLIFCKDYPLYRCLIFEYLDPSSGKNYHFCDGSWYSIAQDYVTGLRDYLNPFFKTDPRLPECDIKNENEYNIVASKAMNAICLDCKNIAPNSESKVEPCDIYQKEKDESASLFHVKIGVHSDNLSHLFNQGVNSIQLLFSEPRSEQKMIELLEAASADTTPVKEKRLKVVYVIITNKSNTLKSKAIPLFSLISLKRAIVALQVSKVPVSVVLVNDTVQRTKYKKERKKRR